MTPKELEARLKTLEDEITRLKDIEEIRKLQKIYCYYLERWQVDQVIPLWSDDPDASVEIANSGVYVGKKSIEKLFSLTIDNSPEFLHVLMPVNDVIDVDTGGKTAKGRWYGIGCYAVKVEGKTKAIFSNGVYENEYVKENGKWKFKKIHWYETFFSPWEDGWVKTPIQPSPSAVHIAKQNGMPDRPTTVYKPYPSGYRAPFHFKNPISGK
jgi:hypothetical protein